MSNIEESLNKIFQDNRIVFWFDHKNPLLTRRIFIFGR
jgi:hypothetical protein